MLTSHVFSSVFSKAMTLGEVICKGQLNRRPRGGILLTTVENLRPCNLGCAPPGSLTYITPGSGLQLISKHPWQRSDTFVRFVTTDYVSQAVFRQTLISVCSPCRHTCYHSGSYSVYPSHLLDTVNH